MAQEVNPKDERETLPAPPPTPEAEHQVAGGSAMQGQRHTEEWREEFPYPWDEDEIMTRRDMLRFLVAGTGALFLATSALAIIGNLPFCQNLKPAQMVKRVN